MFKFFKSNPQESRTLEGVYDQVLESTERYMTRTIGQALSMSMPGFPNELDPETTAVINDALAYWKESKAALLRQAQIMDERDAYLRHELDEQRKFLDQQASLLREQSKTLEEISRKLDKTSKTKAE